MATLELVLTLPILIVPVLAIVYFGVYYANMQQLALACRMGVEEASQTSSLSTTNGDPVPADVLDAIDDTLATAGMKRCRVRLEHNVGGSTVVLVSGACNGGPSSNLGTPPAYGEYVRLTVCVEKSEVVPTCLSGFGFGTSCSSTQVAECTAVFRYELSP